MSASLSNEPTLHPVFRTMNTPLTIGGADRRLFLVALVVGAATFNFFASLLAGLVMFVALYALSRWVTATDPQLLRIVLNSARWHATYDGAKLAHDPPRTRRPW
jgi:type IV secretory pathway TrbD component